MRRIVKIIAYIALVVLMQDSCQKKDNLSKEADSKKEEIEVQREVSVTSFYAYSGENDSKTKTSRKENGDLWWSPGDEIMVFCGEASGKFVSQNKESAEIATFVGLFDKEVSTADVSANGVLAFYPYSEELTREGDAVVFTLPSSQLAVAGTFDDDLYPVIARSDTTELSFYNICGGAKFTVSKKGIKTVTIRGNDSEPLAGKLSVTLDENGIPIVEVVDGETEIVVTAPDGGTFEVGKEYYIVTIPQYLTKGFTLIYNKGLSIYNEFKTTKSINIKRSKFGVLEDLDENLDIADWDDPIEFRWSDVEDICVTEWDTNGDGKLSYKEAALVQTIGIVFQSESIIHFDELKYFTGLTSIGDNAFSGCSSLYSVTIPSSVTSIGDDAFSGCSGLQSVTIPSSVTSIGSSAFYDCGGDLYVNCNIPSYSSYDESPFYSGNFTSLVIGEGVASIGDYAFYGSSGLQSVTIPSSVTSIGNNAFSGCGGDLYVNCNIPSYSSYDKSPFYSGNFTSLVIGEGVTSIGDNAFYGCSGLPSVTIPSSVTSIGNNAFLGCTSLKNITILEGVRMIGDYAFSGCNATQAVTVPQSVVAIGAEAFLNCTGKLTVNCDIPSAHFNSGSFRGSDFSEVEIGEGVTKIGNNAFNQSAVKTVTISNTVTSIGSEAFWGCDKITDLIIPDSVTSIGVSAFEGCSSLTSVVLSESITSISDKLFSGCSLTDITIPNSVTEIGKSAFYLCDITSITIPENVTLIHGYAFGWCENLKTVFIKAETRPAISKNAFDPIPDGFIIYVPYSSLDSYLDSWGVFSAYLRGYAF